MKILPTTKSIILLLKDNKIIRLKKNKDRKDTHLDKVFDNFKELSKTDSSFRCYESTTEPYEMIIVKNEINPNLSSFII